ncbi:MAG TPA: hypothetical protein VFA97_07280 [Gaiellaceae bacterium]|nr:hypothetical protein [Gaiellaceae bacterium]
MIVERHGLRLTVSDDGHFADFGPLRLRPLAALDTMGAPDETYAVEPPVLVDDGVVEVRRRSTAWEKAVVTLALAEDGLEVRTHVRGRGALDTARLLAVRSLLPGKPNGLLPSGAAPAELFTPNPDDPERVTRPARERAVIGVVGDSDPGRGHWFYTPAPLYFVLGDVGISIVAPVAELRFPQLVYEGGDRSFALALEYEGHTLVDGAFDAPTVLLTPGVEDPYEGLRAHRASLAVRGAAPPVEQRITPAWWSEPIFCGWGAQVARGEASGRRAADLATQAEYDDYLGILEREQVVPGTITIDDKWQRTYGRNEPDTGKWPDLHGWIARRHDAGQRVLLWWKAWDAEGLPPELCVRNPAGEPLGVDPSNPDAQGLLAEIVTGMLSPAGLDGDGLKIDFTARTPSGHAATASGSWGIALLHELLSIVHRAAKAAKPAALLVTQTPHPAFVDVADMIRLNDMMRLGDGHGPASVVPQMRHRARVTAAACPELLVDTDDWAVPSLAAWREYLREKSSLGVPALYYADLIEGAGARLGPEDYLALRETWSAWRESRS